MTIRSAEGPERASRKRGHGEGSIARLKNGRWVGTIMLGRRADGKPDRPKVYGETRAEVQRRLAELRTQSEQGVRADRAKGRETLAVYLDSWLEATRATVRPRTWRRYQQVVRIHLVPALGHHRLDSLRPDAIQRLYSDKLGAGLAPWTVLKLHVVLHRALRTAVRWGYVKHNAAELAEPPRIPTRDLTPPGPAELSALLDIARERGDRLWALWTLAVHSGSRQGELLGLCWEDVDLETATLTVRRGLVGIHDQAPVFAEPKSRASRRTIRLGTEAVEALRSHRARQLEDRLRAGTCWVDHGLVFTTHVGTPLIRTNVRRYFKQALERAGLPRTIRFHDLRHAHATLMLRAGVPLKIASHRLGHASVAITGDLYQHIVAELDGDAAERVQRAMRA